MESHGGGQVGRKGPLVGDAREVSLEEDRHLGEDGKDPSTLEPPHQK